MELNLTREEAIKLFRAHWASLAETGSRDKHEFLIKHWPGGVVNSCFLCHYCYGKTCRECPVEWPSGNIYNPGGTPCTNSYYGEWLDAEDAAQRRELAALIAGLPEKKEGESRMKKITELTQYKVTVSSIRPRLITRDVLVLASSEKEAQQAAIAEFCDEELNLVDSYLDLLAGGQWPTAQVDSVKREEGPA